MVFKFELQCWHANCCIDLWRILVCHCTEMDREAVVDQWCQRRKLVYLLINCMSPKWHHLSSAASQDESRGKGSL